MQIHIKRSAPCTLPYLLNAQQVGAAIPLNGTSTKSRFAAALLFCCLSAVKSSWMKRERKKKSFKERNTSRRDGRQKSKRVISREWTWPHCSRFFMTIRVTNSSVLTARSAATAVLPLCHKAKRVRRKGRIWERNIKLKKKLDGKRRYTYY